MKRIALAVAAAVFWSTALPSACAELTPAQKAQARELIQQFTAREFAARQQAVKKLIEMGPDVLPLVRKTLAETKDNEVKLRCEMVIKGIAKKYGLTAAGEKIKPINFDASRVTLDVKNAPLAEVLEELVEQTGNKPMANKTFHDRPVTISVKNMPYWQALDMICRSAGLYAYHTPFDGALLREAKPKSRDLSVYTGPLVVRVWRTERDAKQWQALAFRLKIDEKVVVPVDQRFVSIYTLAHAEDRLPIYGFGARHTKVLSPEGKNLMSKEQQEEARKFPSPLTGAMFSIRAVHVLDTPERIKGPLTVEGKVCIEFVLGKGEIRVDKVFSGERRVAHQDGFTFELLSTRRIRDSVVVTFKLRRRLPNLGRGPFAQPEGFGFVLRDPQGKRRGELGGSITIVDGDSLRFTMNIHGVPKIPGNWSLGYIYPTKIVTKDYPFTIKNVPLP